MDGSFRLRAPASTAAAILVVAGAYVGFAALGFELAYSTKQVTAVWAPAGIALAALLLIGNRVWPGVWIGAFLSNFFNHTPAVVALFIATGSTLGPLLGAYLLRRTGFRGTFTHVRDVFLLLLFGSVAAMIVTSTNGTLTLCIARLVPWHAFGSVWALWWSGDAMGVLIVAPLLLTWLLPSEAHADGGHVEALLLAITTPAIAWFAFASGTMFVPTILRHASFAYPVAIWSALRFRPRETTAVIAAIAIIGILVVARGIGESALATADQRLAATMTFLAILAIASLVLAALTQERRSAQQQLHEALKRTTRVAQTLQEAMLPARLPHHRELEFDALYVTAGEDALVGGNWYDAFVLPNGNVAISVGDVTARGVDAAVAAERIRQTIAVAASESDDPATILSKADRTLTLQRTSTPATAVVAIIDPARREMRYATAGHAPPLVATPDAGTQRLVAGGVPLGLERPIQSLGSEPKTERVALEQGSLVVFYTEGVVASGRDRDAMHAKLSESMARIVKDRVHPHPARTLHRAVVGDAAPRDDAVLLTVRLPARR